MMLTSVAAATATTVAKPSTRASIRYSMPSGRSDVRAGSALSTPSANHASTTPITVAAATMTAEEWGQLPQHGTTHFRGERIWLILGLIREQMTPEQLAHMDASMPPPAVEFWQTAGQGMFDDFVGRLRT